MEDILSTPNYIGEIAQYSQSSFSRNCSGDKFTIVELLHSNQYSLISHHSRGLLAWIILKFRHRWNREADRDIKVA